jgi:two-component system, OmpR family, sensor histidine kinase KdpD
MPASGRRGKLKIYLGYAAGVGKTYQMLEEAQRLKADGVDIVIGYFEPHARKDTIALTEGIPTVPRRKIEYRGTWFEEMDVDATLERHPQVCVVDEFAHTNVPGAARPKRWEDVEALLDGGIDVLTTMNIQHLESLNDHVWQITGIKVKETIPDWVVKQADEVVMVDVTPRALINRLERGVVYPPERVRRALENFFRESTLVALRELALRQTAFEVETRQSDLNEPQQDGNDHGSAAKAGGPSETTVKQERILIHITSDPNTAMLVRRGKRVADYLHTECFAVAVHRNPELTDLPPKEREAIERHLNFARNLHIETRLIVGNNVAESLVEFARLNGITQIFVNRPAQAGWQRFSGWNLVNDIVRLGRDMRIIIVAERKRTESAAVPS